RRHTRSKRDWSSDVCSSDLATVDNEPELPLATVGAALSDLADAALSAALAVAIAQVCHGAPCLVRLAVIAMGKCGARELNYVSEIGRAACRERMRSGGRAGS